MTYSLRDTARSQMKSRLEKIDASERADGPAGTAVSEDYGNKAAGPSSSAKFKRGGAVAGETAKKRLDRPGKKPKREDGGAVLSDMVTRGRATDDKDKPLSVGDPEGPPVAVSRKPHRASGGAVKANKGKTNVNIIIQPQGGGDKEPMPVPMPVAAPTGPPPAPMGPPPAPPIPPQVAAALAAQGGGGGPPPGMPMRKRGGAVKMDAGAGSGEGRLEKAEKYGKKAK